MFNKDVFKNSIKKTQTEMKSYFREELDSKIESQVIDELTSIFLKVAENFTQAAANGSDFPAMQRVANHPQEQRAYWAMLELIERMELDFTQKFVMNFQHDIQKDVEIGKIQISFLDSVRRALNGARIH
ncbi:hypothetical protein D3C87_1154170 [compost metagenome]